MISRYFARAGFDTLDSFGFPTEGIRLLGEYSIYDAKTGRDPSVRRGDLGSFCIPSITTKGQLWVGPGIFLDTCFEDCCDRCHTAVQFWAAFTRLSGLQSRMKFSGRHAGLLSFMGYQRLNERAVFPPLISPLFIGFSLEAGNVFQDRDEISLG